MSNGIGCSVNARSVVSGDRSRKRLSSELPCCRPLLSRGDIIGDGALRGERGGINRIGEEKAAMVMMYWKERIRGHVSNGRHKGDPSQIWEVASGCVVFAGIISG